MKKVLIVATVYKFLSFERSDMEILKNLGYEIHVATNMQEAGWLQDDGSLDYLNIVKHQIDFSRFPFSLQSYKAYRQLKCLMSSHNFNIIHCHTPVAAAIARLAAMPFRNHGLKVIYTDHGFHFHKTSGMKSWLLYYPIEYLLSYFTDLIITINKEDLAVIKRFHSKEIQYIPGVGVDVNQIAKLTPDTDSIRKRFNLPIDAFTILSIGELSARKNHEVVIRALAQIKECNIYYLICGTGTLRVYLQKIAFDLGIEDKVIFAGQVPHLDVLKISHAIEVGVIPSLIEGLGLAGIETLAAGKPLIGSNVHGIKDYVIDGVTGISCNPKNIDEFKNALLKLYNDKYFYDRCAQNCLSKALEFDIYRVKDIMLDVYSRYT